MNLIFKEINSSLADFLSDFFEEFFEANPELIEHPMANSLNKEDFLTRLPLKVREIISCDHNIIIGSTAEWGVSPLQMATTIAYATTHLIMPSLQTAKEMSFVFTLESFVELSYWDTP